MQVKVLVVNSGEENNLELKLTQMFQNIKIFFLKTLPFQSLEEIQSSHNHHNEANPNNNIQGH